MILISTEVAAYLQLQSIGTVGVNLFKERMPASPDTATLLTSTGGFEPDAKHGYDELTLQVMTRADNPIVAFNNITSVYNALHGLNNVTLPSGTFLIHSRAMSMLANIGLDEENRTRFTQNFRLLIRNKTDHRG